MSKALPRFERAISEFDLIHREDPVTAVRHGAKRPRALLYHERLSHWVDKLEPNASVPLQLAARCQHLRRWAIPRASYPEGLAGYRHWRSTLTDFHVQEASSILREVGYDDATIDQFTLDERAVARTPVSIDRSFSYDQEIHGIELNFWKNFSGTTLAHRLGFGLEYRDRTTEEIRDGLSTNLTTGEQTNILLGEVFPLRDFPISRTTETAAFIEDTISFGDWKVIAAVRADQFDLSPEVDAIYLEDYPDYELVSLSESDLSPKLGIIYSLTSGIDVYAQYSHGFRAPPYSDANISLEIPFFGYQAIPNPDLKSESSDGFDIGIRWQGVQSSARLSAFRTSYDDFIESKINLGVDPVTGLTMFQSQNIRATEIEGFEAGWDMRFGANEAFAFDGSAYYARGENVDSGQPLNSVGPAQGVLGLSWFSLDESRQVRLKATFTDAFDRRDESSGEVFKPAGHAVFDLFVTQRLGNRAIIRAGLHNLTDRTYWNWSDVRGVKPTDPILPFLAQAGRSASVSLNVVW